MADRGKNQRGHSVVGGQKGLLDSEERTVGGDTVKAFIRRVQSAKERVKKNRVPFSKSKRAKEIERSMDAIKSRDYQG